MYGILQTPAMAEVERIKISGYGLKRLRLSLHLTAAEFGKLVGLGPDRVRQIEGQDEVGVYPRTLRALAELMKVTPDAAIRKLSKPAKIEQSIGDTDRGIPVINKAPAGKVTDYEECSIVDSGQGQWYVPRDGIDDPNAFAIIITGESMMPTLQEGAVCIFVPMDMEGRTHHKKIAIPDGHIVFVRFGTESPHDGCTIARGFRSGKGIELRKDNKKHKAIRCLTTDIARMAALVRYDVLPGFTKMLPPRSPIESESLEQSRPEDDSQVHPED